MACLPRYLRTKYEADLQRTNDQIEAIETEILAALQNGEVEEYAFNSGEGQQRAKRRSLKELYTVLDQLENKQGMLLRKLNRSGIVNLNLRRKAYGVGNYYGRFR